MPVLKSYPAGVSMHMPAAVSNHQRAKRGRIAGWTAEAVRRHTQWLKTVLWMELTGFGYAITLTMGECPPTPETFHQMRKAMLKRFERMDAIRIHWVVEWTRRKVPHLHLSVYFTRALTKAEEWAIKAAWTEIAGAFVVNARGQDLKAISGPEGWAKYLSKHAARGVGHYQRQGKPDGWETTGRLWGHWGDWPTEPPAGFSLDSASWYRTRRRVRSWRIADARKEFLEARAQLEKAGNDRQRSNALRRLRAARSRLVSAKRCLSHAKPAVSAVRGVSEWPLRETVERLLDLVAEQGGHVEQVS